MSESAAAFGALNPPKVIEHNGKTYRASPVLTEGTMARVEAELYGRAKNALKAARDLYTPEEYTAEVKALRARHEAGEYSFRNRNTMDHLQTDEGALLLLSCMLDADLGELMVLMTEREHDVQELLEEAMELSFPKSKAPRPAKGPGRNRDKKRRR